MILRHRFTSPLYFLSSKHGEVKHIIFHLTCPTFILPFILLPCDEVNKQKFWQTPLDWKHYWRCLRAPTVYRKHSLYFITSLFLLPQPYYCCSLSLAFISFFFSSFDLILLKRLNFLSFSIINP